MRDRRATGRIGEDLACEYLERKGYRILERNVRTRYGEVDIIARQGPSTVFVEVRTVHAGPVVPEESVTRRKQHRMANVAMSYLAKLDRIDSEWRTDVVAIELGAEGAPMRIEHIENAVEGW